MKVKSKSNHEKMQLEHHHSHDVLQFKQINLQFQLKHQPSKTIFLIICVFLKSRFFT